MGFENERFWDKQFQREANNRKNAIKSEVFDLNFTLEREENKEVKDEVLIKELKDKRTELCDRYNNI